MFPAQLHIGASFDAFSFDVTIPTAGIQAWFADLQARNAASRGSADAVPGLTYHDSCPSCGAGMSALTHVEVEEGVACSCLVCRAVFPIGADA